MPVTVLEQMVADIERDLRNYLEREIPSKQIGEMVMDRLRSIDEVAYIRFASVYRKFEDIHTFMEELNRLQKESRRNLNHTTDKK